MQFTCACAKMVSVPVPSNWEKLAGFLNQRPGFYKLAETKSLEILHHFQRFKSCIQLNHLCWTGPSSEILLRVPTANIDNKTIPGRQLFLNATNKYFLHVRLYNHLYWMSIYVLVPEILILIHLLIVIIYGQNLGSWQSFVTFNLLINMVHMQRVKLSIGQKVANK